MVQVIRVKLKRRMTPEEIDDGYKMMREWRRYFPSKSSKGAASRYSENVAASQRQRSTMPIEREEAVKEKAAPPVQPITRLI